MTQTTCLASFGPVFLNAAAFQLRCDAVAVLVLPLMVLVLVLLPLLWLLPVCCVVVIVVEVMMSWRSVTHTVTHITQEERD